MKKLVIYYSLTGVVDKAAKSIAKKADADIYRIESARKYDLDMWAAWDQAQVEIANNDMPELSGQLPDISQYDEIIIGGPVWGYSISNPIHSYLSLTDFQGKKVSAFWTYYDYDEKYVKTFNEALKNADYQSGINLSMSVLNNQAVLNETIEKWIKSLN